MKETGLMFKAPLVRAILSGQKTQTRRVFSKHMEKLMRYAAAAGEVSNFMDEGCMQPNDLGYVLGFSPVGVLRDRIYVRETFARVPTVCGSDELVFAADYQDGSDKAAGVKYTPAIHMPKDSARLWLEVTGVRVERLQSISDDDLACEGIQEYIDKGVDHDGTPRDTFRKLWETTGGDWKANPWVWVIDFKRIEKP